MRFLSIALSLANNLGLIDRIIKSQQQKNTEYKLPLLELYKTNKALAKYLIYANIGQSILWTVLLFVTTGFFFYFSIVSAVWGIINAIIFAFAFSQSDTKQKEVEGSTLSADLQNIFGLQNTVAINIGLDIAYGIFGYYLIDRGTLTNAENLIGFGAGILLQGLVLLVIDIVLLVVNRRLGREVVERVEE